LLPSAAFVHSATFKFNTDFIYLDETPRTIVTSSASRVVHGTQEAATVCPFGRPGGDMRLFLCLLLVLLLPACAINPVHQTGLCNFKRSVIDVDMPSGGAEAVPAAAGMLSPPPRKTSEDLLFDALSRSGTVGATSDGRPIAPAMLFLSGGSQHGAFGAGFLKGWKERETHLPKFAVVTGISTGAILSTFAFIDEPDVMAKAYSIQNENRLLKPLVSVKGGSPTIKGYVGLVKKGAIADLRPLRGFLSDVLNDSVLADVAAGALEGRILRVGVVNVDTGTAVSLDLADMARRWATADAALQAAGSDTIAAEKARKAKEEAKACYVEAIVASSSAPLAALPVFIDERMYIDGGARFGAYSNEFEKFVALARRPANLVRGKALSPTVYLLINGDQNIPSRCGRKDDADCDPPRTSENKGKPLGDPAEDKPADGKLPGPHGKWQFLKMALRSEQILGNQVYRFSADSIANLARREKMSLYYAQINADKGAHPFHLKDDKLGEGDMTCDQAYELDKRLLDPVQFYPRYMRCLVDYGYRRGLVEWVAEE